MSTKKKPDSEKNPAAVELGRLGGSAKTKKPKGLAALSPARRAEIARQGGLRKWAKAKKDAAKTKKRA